MARVIRVLLIEDDEDDYLLTRQMLFDSNETQFHLDWVSSYPQAVVHLQRAEHDIYLIDYRLGAHDGLELLKQFATTSFPMIMLTGEDTREVDLEAMRLGAMDYLVKGQINTALLERSIRYSIARKRTEEALRRKDEFLAMLSHELRNPLAPIRTALHVLEMPQVSQERAQQAKEIINRQVNNLVRLVDDLLDASRIMYGRIELRKEPVDLRDIVKHAIETAQPTMDRQGHHLNLTLPSEQVFIEADAVRMAQAISNLLMNSAKYTDRTGQIWIEAAVEGDDAVIRVRDTGMGIDAELLPHIFDLFTQGEHPLARSQGGLGIGLTLVKRIVELHEGNLTASSAGRGKGSEFVVCIPVTAKALAITPVSQAARDHDYRRVLVVDDNVDAADCLGTMLAVKGHQVEVAYDGFDAVETAKRQKPDVILLDIGLPGRDGYEVAQILRAEPGFQNTKIIAVTGYGKDEDRHRSRAAGMDDHV